MRIRVHSLPSDAQLAAGFPRLAARGGVAAADLAHVPTLLRLPPGEGARSAYRLADAAVLALVIAATVAWVVRRRMRGR